MLGYGSTALWCSANGIGPIHYQWEMYQSSNDGWIIPVHRVVNSTSPTLKFSMISEEDEGIYRCVATNDDGSVASNNATITVYGMYIITYTGGGKGGAMELQPHLILRVHHSILFFTIEIFSYLLAPPGLTTFLHQWNLHT